MCDVESFQSFLRIVCLISVSGGQGKLQRASTLARRVGRAGAGAGGVLIFCRPYVADGGPHRDPTMYVPFCCRWVCSTLKYRGGVV